MTFLFGFLLFTLLLLQRHAKVSCSESNISIAFKEDDMIIDTDDSLNYDGRKDLNSLKVASYTINDPLNGVSHLRRFNSDILLLLKSNIKSEASLKVLQDAGYASVDGYRSYAFGDMTILSKIEFSKVSIIPRVENGLVAEFSIRNSDGISTDVALVILFVNSNEERDSVEELSFIEGYASNLTEKGYLAIVQVIGNSDINPNVFKGYLRYYGSKYRTFIPKSQKSRLKSQTSYTYWGRENFIPHLYEFTLACAGGVNFDHRSSKDSLKIATFNTWMLFRTYKFLKDFDFSNAPTDLVEHMQNVTDAIMKADPDVIILQEVQDLLTLQMMCGMMDGKLGVYSPHILGFGKDAMKIAILTKIALVGEPKSISNTRGFLAKLKIGGSNIAIIGVHFLAANSHYKGNRTEQSILRIFNEIESLREDGYGVIVAGDFNIPKEDPNGIDGLLSSNGLFNPSATFYAAEKTYTHLFKVEYDRIYFDEGLMSNLHDFRIYNSRRRFFPDREFFSIANHKETSDHSIVYAELKLETVENICHELSPLADIFHHNLKLYKANADDQELVTAIKKSFFNLLTLKQCSAGDINAFYEFSRQEHKKTFDAFYYEMCSDGISQEGVSDFDRQQSMESCLCAPFKSLDAPVYLDVVAETETISEDSQVAIIEDHLPVDEFDKESFIENLVGLDDDEIGAEGLDVTFDVIPVVNQDNQIVEEICFDDVDNKTADDYFETTGFAVGKKDDGMGAEDGADDHQIENSISTQISVLTLEDLELMRKSILEKLLILTDQLSTSKKDLKLLILPIVLEIDESIKTVHNAIAPSKLYQEFLIEWESTLKALTSKGQINLKKAKVKVGKVSQNLGPLVLVLKGNIEIYPVYTQGLWQLIYALQYSLINDFQSARFHYVKAINISRELDAFYFRLSECTTLLDFFAKFSNIWAQLDNTEINESNNASLDYSQEQVVGVLLEVYEKLYHTIMMMKDLNLPEGNFRRFMSSFIHEEQNAQHRSMNQYHLMRNHFNLLPNSNSMFKESNLKIFEFIKPLHDVIQDFILRQSSRVEVLFLVEHLRTAFTNLYDDPSLPEYNQYLPFLAHAVDAMSRLGEVYEEPLEARIPFICALLPKIVKLFSFFTDESYSGDDPFIITKFFQLSKTYEIVATNLKCEDCLEGGFEDLERTLMLRFGDSTVVIHNIVFDMDLPIPVEAPVQTFKLESEKSALINFKQKVLPTSGYQLYRLYDLCIFLIESGLEKKNYHILNLSPLLKELYSELEDVLTEDFKKIYSSFFADGDKGTKIRTKHKKNRKANAIRNISHDQVIIGLQLLELILGQVNVLCAVSSVVSVPKTRLLQKAHDIFQSYISTNMDGIKTNRSLLKRVDAKLGELDRYKMVHKDFLVNGKNQMELGRSAVIMETVYAMADVADGNLLRMNERIEYILERRGEIIVDEKMVKEIGIGLEKINEIMENWFSEDIRQTMSDDLLLGALKLCFPALNVSTTFEQKVIITEFIAKHLPFLQKSPENLDFIKKCEIHINHMKLDITHYLEFNVELRGEKEEITMAARRSGLNIILALMSDRINVDLKKNAVAKERLLKLKKNSSKTTRRR